MLISFLLVGISCSAQWFVGLKLMGVSIHIDDGLNRKMYRVAIGKEKRIAFHIGIGLTCEYKFNNWFSAKYDQVAFRDCAGVFAGMSMFNLRYTHDLGNVGDISAGLGPFFYYRKSWFQFGQYQDDGYFTLSANKKWQTKFVWYGGEIEYNYPINENLDWSTNVLPGIPVVVAIASGVRSEIR